MLIARALCRPVLPMMFIALAATAQQLVPGESRLTAEKDLDLQPVPLIVLPAQHQELTRKRIVNLPAGHYGCPGNPQPGDLLPRRIFSLSVYALHLLASGIQRVDRPREVLPGQFFQV